MSGHDLQVRNKKTFTHLATDIVVVAVAKRRTQVGHEREQVLLVGALEPEVVVVDLAEEPGGLLELEDVGVRALGVGRHPNVEQRPEAVLAQGDQLLDEAHAARGASSEDRPAAEVLVKDLEEVGLALRVHQLLVYARLVQVLGFDCCFDVVLIFRAD